MPRKQKYTVSPMPQELRDVAALFTDNQVILYTVCLHHVDEVIKHETEELQHVEIWSGTDLVRWLVFRTPRGEKFCNVCIQLLENSPDKIRPMSRVATRGVEIPSGARRG